MTITTELLFERAAPIKIMTQSHKYDYFMHHFVRNVLHINFSIQFENSIWNAWIYRRIWSIVWLINYPYRWMEKHASCALCRTIFHSKLKMKTSNKTELLFLMDIPWQATFYHRNVTDGTTFEIVEERKKRERERLGNQKKETVRSNTSTFSLSLSLSIHHTFFNSFDAFGYKINAVSIIAPPLPVYIFGIWRKKKQAAHNRHRIFTYIRILYPGPGQKPSFGSSTIVTAWDYGQLDGTKIVF